MGFTGSSSSERDKSEHVAPSVVPEFETLVVPLGATWVSLARTRGVFERDVLPGIWRAPAGIRSDSPKAIHPTPDLGNSVLRNRRQPALAGHFRSRRSTASRRVISCRCRSNGCGSIANAIIPHAFAAVRQGAREGTLLDVATDQIFHRAAAAQSARDPDGRRKRPAAGIQADQPVLGPADQGARDLSAPSRPNSSNSTALVDSDYVVKVYRKLEPGINPEIEIGRFLTEVADFANTPGAARQRRADRRRTAKRDRDRACALSKTRATAGP